MPKNPFKFRKYRLLAPGPVPLSPEVQKCLGQPMIHHRTPEFEDLLQDVLLQLKTVFQTTQPVMTLTSTGSGAMESAIVNTLSPGDEVIVVESGKFGQRWSQIANRFDVKPHTIKVPWGEPVQVSQINEAFQRHPRSKALLCQACETSTATQHPIKDIADLMKARSEALFIVDAITGLGAMNLPMDEWGIDVLVSGSQKAFMLPTGLSFVALSEKAWAMNANAQCARFYFDLASERKANLKNQTRFSSSVSLLRALKVSLKQMLDPSLDATIKNTQRLSEATHKAIAKLGLSLYSKAPAPSVTAVLLPDGLDGVQLRDHIAAKYNVDFIGGQDQLKGRILRIGHLGWIPNKDLLVGIEALGLSLLDMKTPNIGREQVKAAIQACEEHLESTRH